MSAFSWFTGTCKACKYPVVVTQPNTTTNPYADYRWYCSNPDCRNHYFKQHTGDMETPDFVELPK